MTPKDKAQELYDLFIQHSESFHEKEHTKQCALICCDELIEQANLMDGGFSFEKEITFWNEVKEEINKL